MSVGGVLTFTSAVSNERYLQVQADLASDTTRQNTPTVGEVDLTYQITSTLPSIKYYYLGSQRVAMRQENEVYYLHGDHLGSTSLTTNVTGTVVAETRHHPFGEVRWQDGVNVTDFGFTGQREEVGFGLMDYKARFYSPGLGRFVSADTVVPDPMNPQLFNRYSYAGNNPVRYNDPDGHCGPLCQAGINLGKGASPSSYNLTSSAIRFYRQKTTQNLTSGGTQTTYTPSSSVVVGSRTILTHDHFFPPLQSTYLKNEKIVIDDQQGNLQTFSMKNDIHIPFTEKNKSNLFILPVGINLGTPATLGDPSQLQVGDTLTVVYWDDANSQYLSEEVELLHLDPTDNWGTVSDYNHIFNKGDSGGGVFNSNGELIGNNYGVGSILYSDKSQEPILQIALLPQGINQYIQ